MRAVTGVVMAGGRSSRMRETNGSEHKALVLVGGISLLERNLRSLFTNGIDCAVVVSSVEEPAIDAFVRDRGDEIARSFGARLDSYRETTALGNIGVAAELSGPQRDLVVLYVDNLCPIDLRAMLAAHRRADAALTLATHVWGLRNPFGELALEGDRIVGYHEKPVRDVRISSGTCVIAPKGAAAIPPGRAFGASDLFAELRRKDLPVLAYLHDEPWIDVNDAAALHSAEALVRAHPEKFV